MLSTSDHALKIPLQLWVDHILPILPLKTIVSVTTSLNKNSREEFSKHRESIWKKYIEQEHPYLKAIARACRNFGTGDGDLSWFDYIKYCQDLSTEIEYTGSADGDGKGLRQGYKLAYNVGRSHYILYTDNMKHQPKALRDLRTKLFTLKFTDGCYFLDRETYDIKDKDVFNSYGMFSSMFDPSFALLYVDVTKKLNTITTTIRSDLHERGFFNTQDCVNYIIEYVIEILNKGLEKSNYSFIDYIEKDRNCSALRYIMRFEKITTLDDLNKAFIVLSEILRRLEYVIDVQKVYGTMNGEDGYKDKFVFQLEDDFSIFFYFGLNENGFYQGSFLTISGHWPDWFKRGFLSLYEETVESEDEEEPDEYLEDKLFTYVIVLYKLPFFDLYTCDEGFERREFRESFIDEQAYLCNTIDQNYYGGLSYPPLNLKKPERGYIGLQVGEDIGKMVITSRNIAVIVGYDTEKDVYYCLSMLNEVFLENPWETGMELDSDLEDDEVTISRNIFKYNTYIGGFFESFENQKYVGYRNNLF